MLDNSAVWVADDFLMEVVDIEKLMPDKAREYKLERGEEDGKLIDFWFYDGGKKVFSGSASLIGISEENLADAMPLLITRIINTSQNICDDMINQYSEDQLNWLTGSRPDRLRAAFASDKLFSRLQPEA